MTVSAIPTNMWTPQTIDNALVQISTSVAKLRRRGYGYDNLTDPTVEIARQLEAHLEAHPREATPGALRLCKDLQDLASNFVR